MTKLSQNNKTRESNNSFLENIFSMRNHDNHKVITILGIKLKLRYYQKVNFPKGTEACSYTNNIENIRKLAIFASYSSDGRIHDYVVYYLKELHKIYDGIIFIADNPIYESELDKIKDYILYAECKRHGEYDFGSYKHGYLYAREHKLLDNCEELILCNDSCYGPLYPFEDMFNQMAKEKCDFWGVTLNPQGIDIIENDISYKYDYPHIQSFFLVFKKQVFNSNVFIDFINNIKKEKSKWDIIINYEIKLTEILNKSGFTHSAYCKLSFNRQNSFDTHKIKLLLLNKNPLIKTTFFRTSKNNKKLLSFINKYTDYNTTLITKDLKVNSKKKKLALLQNIFSIKNNSNLENC